MPECLISLLTFLTKLALAGNCNVMFSSSNLGGFSKELSDIYVADLLGSSLL